MERRFKDGYYWASFYAVAGPGEIVYVVDDEFFLPGGSEKIDVEFIRYLSAEPIDISELTWPGDEIITLHDD